MQRERSASLSYVEKNRTAWGIGCRKERDNPGYVGEKNDCLCYKCNDPGQPRVRDVRIRIT